MKHLGIITLGLLLASSSWAMKPLKQGTKGLEEGLHGLSLQEDPALLHGTEHEKVHEAWACFWSFQKDQAEILLHKAYEDKDPVAGYLLGVLLTDFFDQEVTFRDREKAKEYFEASAALGYLPSKARLARMKKGLFTKKSAEEDEIFEALSLKKTLSLHEEYELSLLTIDREKHDNVTTSVHLGEANILQTALKASAERGHPGAEYKLACVHPSKDNAFLRDAALHGHVQALKVFVQDFYNVKEALCQKDEIYEKIFQHIDVLIEKDSVMQAFLATSYKNGGFLAKDWVKAAEFYHKIIDQKRSIGHEEYQLFEMYHEGGFGLEKDTDKAMDFLRKSSVQRYTYGTYKLGIMMKQEGQLSVAENCLRQAIDQSDASFHLAEILVKDEYRQNEALDWYRHFVKNSPSILPAVEAEQVQYAKQQIKDLKEHQEKMKGNTLDHIQKKMKQDD